MAYRGLILFLYFQWADTWVEKEFGAKEVFYAPNAFLQATERRTAERSQPFTQVSGSS